MLDIKNGILGTDSLKPFEFPILIISLAYICFSVEHTGILRFVAEKIVAKFSKSYHLLYASLYILNCFLTTILSNDVVILTMTPLTIHVCEGMDLDPVPFLMGEFIAANTMSIALIVGNPTNMIVGAAYELSFIEYSKIKT